MKIKLKSSVILALFREGIYVEGTEGVAERFERSAGPLC